MLELREIKELHEKAYNYSQPNRERAADDLSFYWITQWDDDLLSTSQLQYKGEFNIVKKAGRQIMSEISANPVQVDFAPKDEDIDDGAELIDGVYRSVDRTNTSIESYNVASTESVVCGYGAWVLYTDYETSRAGDRNQSVKRRPIPEANNTVFFDPNAKLQDKSDADYVSILHPYSRDGYQKLSVSLTGEETPISNFGTPEENYSFQWIGSNDVVYVAEFYHRDLVKSKVYTMVDPFGMEQVLSEKEVDGLMDELIDSGFNVVAEKEIERYQITRYIASGGDILDTSVIAGDNLPVVPVYGERAYIAAEEHYEGVTRIAKDPQRLRNFQMSYLADIVSRSPRTKPIFTQDQVQGFEQMYSEVGAENNYPYLLQNEKSLEGEPLPLGPVGVMPEQPIPASLMVSIDLSRQAVEDVANPGLPQDIADPDMSGKAIYAIQNRMDMQSMIYQDGLKHAKRRDGEIFVGMLSEIMDVPRKVKLTKPDGTTEVVEVMQEFFNPETGEMEVLNDLSSQEFDVYSDVGPSFTSRKEQTVERLTMMSANIPPGDPMRNVILLKTLEMLDGDSMDDIRGYAKKQLLIQGVREPETDEEKQELAELEQKGNEPSAEDMLGRAEMMKGEADLMDAQTKKIDAQVRQFDAQTKRITALANAKESGFTVSDKMKNTDIAAAKAGAEIKNKTVDTMTKAAQLRSSMQPDYSQMSNEELVRIARGA